jgi:hypothetical protein
MHAAVPGNLGHAISGAKQKGKWFIRASPPPRGKSRR